MSTFRQGRHESLGSFISRFLKASAEVTDGKMMVVESAFMNGLLPDGKLRFDLLLNPPKSFDEMIARANQHAFTEEHIEDAVSFDRADHHHHHRNREPSDRSRRRSDQQKNRSDEYNNKRRNDPSYDRARVIRQSVNQMDFESVGDEVDVDKCIDAYCEAVTQTKNNGIEGSGQKTYCVFHRQEGHGIEECRVFRSLLMKLSVGGKLKEILERPSDHNGKRPEKSEVEKPYIPKPVKGKSVSYIDTIFTITGGMGNQALRRDSINTEDYTPIQTISGDPNRITIVSEDIKGI